MSARAGLLWLILLTTSWVTSVLKGITAKGVLKKKPHVLLVSMETRLDSYRRTAANFVTEASIVQAMVPLVARLTALLASIVTEVLRCLLLLTCSPKEAGRVRLDLSVSQGPHRKKHV